MLYKTGGAYACFEDDGFEDTQQGYQEFLAGNAEILQAEYEDRNLNQSGLNFEDRDD